MIAATKSQQPPEAARLMADDHSELDELIDDLLAALDEENKTLSFQRLDLLWARRGQILLAPAAHLGMKRLNALSMFSGMTMTSSCVSCPQP